MTSSSEKNPLEMDSYQSLDLLRQTPTRELWSVVLRRVLHGDFRVDVERLGCEGFVRTNLSEAEPAWRAEIELYAAMEELAKSWHPEERRPAVYLERLLQLLSSFTPPSGFTRILGQLDMHGGFNIADETPVLKKQVLDLALEALGNYYTAPPADAQTDTGFGFYSGFLYNKLDDPQMAVHACRRLVELGMLKPSAEEVERTFQSYPQQMIQEFLQTFLVTRHTLSNSAVSTIYGLCFQFDYASAFSDSLHHFGYRLQHWDRPMLVAPTGDKCPMDRDLMKRYMTGDAMKRYITVRHRHAYTFGNAKLEQLGKAR
ncbi:MAG TPA: hypothetical protein VI636_23465 [Candidatus Angelobacter sp.]